MAKNKDKPPAKPRGGATPPTPSGSHASGGSSLTSAQVQALGGAQVAVEQQAAIVQRQKERVRELAKRLEDAGKDGRKKIHDKLVKQLDALEDAKAKISELREKRDGLRVYELRTQGELNAPIDPYSRAEDIQAEFDENERHDDLYRDEDAKLREEAAESLLLKAAIDKKAKFDRRDSADYAASRGLAHSSIRDADLFDIDATASLRKKDLDTRFDSHVLTAQSKKLAADAARDNFYAALRQKQVQNAQEDSAGLPKYAVDPTTTQALLDIPRAGKGGKKGGNRPGPQTYTPAGNGGGGQNNKGPYGGVTG